MGTDQANRSYTHTISLKCKALWITLYNPRVRQCHMHFYLHRNQDPCYTNKKPTSETHNDRYGLRSVSATCGCFACHAEKRKKPYPYLTPQSWGPSWWEGRELVSGRATDLHTGKQPTSTHRPQHAQQLHSALLLITYSLKPSRISTYIHSYPFTSQFKRRKEGTW